MAARQRSEIIRDLNALMAELNASMLPPDSDISPKLAEALDQTRSAPVPDQTREPKTHEEIRAAARAYKPTDYETFIHPGPKAEKAERLKDYTPADDPDWPPDSAWMGTGDDKLIE